MQLTRRAFIHGSGSIALLRRGLILAGVSTAALSPTPAKAWVQVAMLALSAISLFSKKGDGGLSAILGAMNQKLDLISGQLVQIQSSLAAIMGDVQSVKELIVERSDDQLVRPYIAEIQGSIIQYAPFFRAYPSPARMRTPANRAQLEKMLDRIVRASTSLQASIVPQLPLVGATIPIAFGIELLMLELLETDRAYVRQVKARYASWIDEILSRDSPRSIYIYVDGYVDKLQAIWGDLQKYPGVSLSGYSFRSGSSDDAIAEVCHMSHEENPRVCTRSHSVSHGGARSEGGGDGEVCDRWEIPRGPKSLLVDRFILKSDQSSGVMLDTYRHERSIAIAPLPPFIPKRQWKYLGPRTPFMPARFGIPDPASQIPFAACTSEKFRIARSDDERRARLSGSATAKRLDQDDAEIGALIERANEQRYKIALAMSAVLALQETRNQLDVALA